MTTRGALLKKTLTEQDRHKSREELTVVGPKAGGLPPTVSTLYIVFAHPLAPDVLYSTQSVPLDEGTLLTSCPVMMMTTTVMTFGSFADGWLEVRFQEGVRAPFSILLSGI
jgi:hypothetical protein